MKKIKYYFLTMLLLLHMGSVAIYANDTTTEAGDCEFTGKEMKSTFDSTTVAASVAEMEPGDTVAFAINIHNNS